jgi:hypothetical protein
MRKVAIAEPAIACKSKCVRVEDRVKRVVILVEPVAP